MDLKNAATICLISLFSATLVVLIARSLDSQAALQLEPQLIRIANELETIRKQGRLATVPDPTVASESSDQLAVYYLHGNFRCPTCRAIEAQAYEAVQSGFASELKSEQIAWKIFNYDKPAGAPLKKKFDVEMPVVVLAKINGGEITGWNRLDRVWPLANDKPEFIEYVQAEIRRALENNDDSPLDESDDDGQPLWTPTVDPNESPSTDATPNIPLPE